MLSGRFNDDEDDDESGTIIVARDPSFEMHGHDGFDSEWLSCALAQAAFDSCRGLNRTVTFPELTKLVSKAIESRDLILFVDALDECKDPDRTAKFLESATDDNSYFPADISLWTIRFGLLSG